MWLRGFQHLVVQIMRNNEQLMLKTEPYEIVGVLHSKSMLQFFLFCCWQWIHPGHTTYEATNSSFDADTDSATVFISFTSSLIYGGDDDHHHQFSPLPNTIPWPTKTRMKSKLQFRMVKWKFSVYVCFECSPLATVRIYLFGILWPLSSIQYYLICRIVIDTFHIMLLLHHPLVLLQLLDSCQNHAASKRLLRNN